MFTTIFGYALLLNSFVMKIKQSSTKKNFYIVFLKNKTWKKIFVENLQFVRGNFDTKTIEIFKKIFLLIS